MAKLDETAFIQQLLVGNSIYSCMGSHSNQACVRAIDAAIKKRYQELRTLEIAKTSIISGLSSIRGDDS